jgi:serine phosphatase RsbU (regulator of sigma subunit)
VVGGDFYVFRAEENGFLVGVVDCAGHGVPGALMTMVAHSAIEVALDALGPTDPARLLARLDTQVRAMLQHDASHSLVASQMEAGLFYIDFDKKLITFAGAKISLYWCDGATVEEIKGDRYSIGSKREAEFNNQSLPLSSAATYYLTTDGLLDQGGGPRGFSFGGARFTELLRRYAGRPLAEQEQAMAAELAEYQDGRAQRDDITVLGFRF